MQSNVREVRLNIENEFVLNLMAYFTTEENYVFVGNEGEVWLENLDHPKVQLIYINVQAELTHANTTFITQKLHFVMRNIRRKFLMHRVNALVLNVERFDEYTKTEGIKNISFVNVENAEAVYENQTLRKLFPGIATTNLSENIVELATRLKNDSKTRALQDVGFSMINKSPLVTQIYLVILGLFCLYLMFQIGRLPNTPIPADVFAAIHYGATFSPLIVAGEYWRLFTAAFIHLSLVHFFFNAMFMYRFGALLENVIGKWRFIFVIIVSALMGSLFGFAFSPRVSVGASGVAYGFIGVLLFLSFEMRKTFMPMTRQLVTQVMGFTLLFSFAMPNIDHFGHLGGLIGGFLATAIVGTPRTKPFMIRSVLSVVSLIILASGLWIRGVNLSEQENFNDINRALIFQYSEMGNITRAEQLLRALDIEVE
ncbi:MAG: rhomboid family intramembrane serine protease [Turicibacter sp.]|nr:rhomboid family intramembrane serine protease [Turicibacter sp.]